MSIFASVKSFCHRHIRNAIAGLRTLKLSETMKIKFYPMAAAVLTVMGVSCTDIIPQAYDPGLSLNTAAVDFRYEGGSEVLKITSNTPWTIEMEECDWLSVSLTSGESTGKVILTAEPNMSEENTREATITVTSEDVTREIVISQDKYVRYVSMTINTGTEEAPVWTEMSTFDAASITEDPLQKIQIRVESNAAWKLTPPANNDGISFSKESGGGEDVFPVSEIITMTLDNKTVNITDGSAFYISEMKLALADGTSESTLTIRQKNPYSNCYIINSPGEYTIPAYKPDGTPVTATDARWLFETEKGLISGTEPKLEEGIITFTVAESQNADEKQRGGYGIIALMNGTDVAWSYAIWYTKELRDIQIGSYTVMDRNLMAWTDNLPTADFGNKTVPGAYGCLYQWGSKNPLPCPSQTAIDRQNQDKMIEHHDEMFTEKYFMKGNFNTGFKNPDGTEATYYDDYGNNNTEPMSDDTQTKYPWLFWNSQYSNTEANRWSDTQKTVNDPCPAGYKVPSISQISEMAGILSNNGYSQPFTGDSNNWCKVYTMNGVTFSFMHPGYINNQHGTPFRAAKSTVGVAAAYYSSTGFQAEWDGGSPDNLNTVCSKAIFDWNTAQDKVNTRSALAVRCVKM